MPALAPGLRRAFGFLRDSPLHPQWLVLRQQRSARRELGAQLAGVVLDLGCAGGELRACLPAGARYVGLDYLPTAAGDYGTRPDVYGTALALPFADGSADGVALLDVLEHLPDPGRCLREVARVLKPGGLLALQVPFLYPLHDEPRDYFRFSEHGLRELARAHGFEVGALSAVGTPIQSAAAVFCMALAKTLLNLWRPGAPLALLGLALLAPLAALAIPAVNLFGWGLSRVTPNDAFMPLAYRMLCRRTAAGATAP